jgi:cytoskeletal protein RodZ
MLALRNNGDPAMSTVGVEFRAIRESRGLTVDRIASATRIPVRYIEALERDDVRALPARPYLRGFVAAYGRELGLDPADALSRYFGHVAPPPPEPVRAAAVTLDEPGYSRTWGIAVLVLAVLLAIPAFNKWRSGVEPPQPAVAGTTGTVPAATAAVAPAAAVPTATDQGAVVPSPLVVSMTFERPCWLTASADGTRVVYKTMEPGSTQVLKASREIAIRVGDAGAVAWTVNGRAQAPLGGPGEVRNVVLTPPGSAPAIK